MNSKYTSIVDVALNTRLNVYKRSINHPNLDEQVFIPIRVTSGSASNLKAYRFLVDHEDVLFSKLAKIDGVLYQIFVVNNMLGKIKVTHDMLPEYRDIEKSPQTISAIFGIGI